MEAGGKLIHRAHSTLINVARGKAVSLRFRINLFIFSRIVSSFGPFCWRFHASFAVPQVGKPSHHSRNKRTSSTVFQFLPSISGEGYPYPLCTPNLTQGHPMPPKGRSRRHARFFARWGGTIKSHQQRVAARLLITRSPDLFHPHPPFSNSCCKQTTFSIRRLGGPCATLGWPLGGPRATQGPPNPKPNPNPRLRDIGRGSQLQNAKTRRQAGSNHSCGTAVLGGAFLNQISRGPQPPSAAHAWI